jgi:hypothetical protein
MISINTIGNSWKTIRNHQQEKFNNYKWIEKFESELKNITNNIDISTTIGYYTNSTYNSYLIEYCENTPITYFFKMSPNRYFLDKFNHKLWHRHDVDTSITSKFFNANKYTLRDEVYQLDKPYILFALQSVNFTSYSMSKKLFIELVHWAEINKKYVLFKLHPFTTSDNKILLYWNMLKEAGVIKKYAILVDSKYNTDKLISNSDAVWTYSSGVGLNAVIQDKIVVAFTDQLDYTDLYTICKNPNEAILATNKSKLDMDRFLSWYYNKLIIDVSREDLNTQISNRIQICVENNYDIERIF